MAHLAYSIEDNFEDGISYDNGEGEDVAAAQARSRTSTSPPAVGGSGDG